MHLDGSVAEVLVVEPVPPTRRLLAVLVQRVRLDFKPCRQAVNDTDVMLNRFDNNFDRHVDSLSGLDMRTVLGSTAQNSNK